MGTSIALSQEDASWFYLRAKDTLFEVTFNKIDGNLKYTGEDTKLKNVLDQHTITTFKKTYRKARKENLKKTFFVISEKRSLMEDLLKEASHVFEYGEHILEEDKKIFEPNDYGLTSTIGDNKGFQVNLDYLDFLEVPKAWYYTTGSAKTIIGISDGTVDTTNLDFKGKTKVFQKSSFSNGHGSGVASIAAGQGDNAFGVPGVCYDCGIYATSYGHFRSFEQLLELSKAGVRVINCSWLNGRYYETAQAVIDEMFDNGTIIVAASGNSSWIKTDEGEKLYYPASYNHVVSVSTVMYKHESISDNILKLNDDYYADNIKYHLGRTIGFKDNDPSKTPRIYPVSVTTLNTEVDILAPSADLFSFGRYVKNGSKTYIHIEATSPAAPIVTGTIGLMFSLYPCLEVDEVESILKITSKNIDHIELNKPYLGKNGAGALNTGKAVEMVYQLYSEKETAFIENQNFTRWDFKLTSLSKGVIIRNQKFTDGATLELNAKNKIVLAENTSLKPGVDGSITLKINSTLQKECDLVLRDPSIED